MVKYIVKSFILGQSNNIKLHTGYSTANKAVAVKVAKNIIDNKNGMDILKNTRKYKGAVLPDTIKSKDVFFFSTRNCKHCIFIDKVYE